MPTPTCRYRSHGRRSSLEERMAALSDDGHVLTFPWPSDDGWRVHAAFGCERGCRGSPSSSPTARLFPGAGRAGSVRTNAEPRSARCWRGLSGSEATVSRRPSPTRQTARLHFTQALGDRQPVEGCFDDRTFSGPFTAQTATPLLSTIAPDRIEILRGDEGDGLRL